MVSVPRSGSTVVTLEALFSSHLDPNLVKQVFLNKTLNASSHWLGATYQLKDLHVIGTNGDASFISGSNRINLVKAKGC